MPTHAEKRRVPYSAGEMYALIADVKSYPEFLPWCEAARIRSSRPGPDGSEVIAADLVISFKVFRERFGSEVRLQPEERKIDVEYLDGPFRYLRNHWRFIEDEPGSCEIDFYVDFEFKSFVLQKLIGVVFNEAMQRIVRAFEARAEALYGARRSDAGVPRPLDLAACAAPDRPGAAPSETAAAERGLDDPRGRPPFRRSQARAASRSRPSAWATLARRTSRRPSAPNSTVAVAVSMPRPARPKQTRPSGLLSDPPGPAIPVMETARSARERSSAPSAMARATSSETAPCASISAAGTPRSSVLASFE